MTRSYRHVAIPTLGLALALGLAGCGAGPAPEVDEEAAATTELSQEEIEATVPELQADGQRVAEAAMELIKTDALPEAEAFQQQHPLEENHYYGSWDVTGEAGSFCLEYRPAEDAEAVSFVTYSLSYIPPISGGTEPVDERIAASSEGLNAGCV